MADLRTDPTDVAPDTCSYHRVIKASMSGPREDICEHPESPARECRMEQCPLLQEPDMVCTWCGEEITEDQAGILESAVENYHMDCWPEARQGAADHARERDY